MKKLRDRRRMHSAYLEALESRTLLSAMLIPTSDHAGLVYDDQRNRLYITNDTNVVKRYDLTAGQFLTPWTFGTQITDGDISVDGQTVYFNDLVDPVIHVVNAATGAVSPLAIPDGTHAYHVLTMDDGSLVIQDIDRASALEQINPATGAWVRQDFAAGLPVRSTDHATGLALGLNNPETVALFTGNSTPTTFMAPGYHLLWNASISPDNSMLALPTNRGARDSIDFFSNTGTLLKNMDGRGAIFDPRGNGIVYVANGNSLLAYDTSNFQVVRTIDLGETYFHDNGSGFDGPSLQDMGLMRAALDGHALFVNTPSGIRVVDLPTNNFASQLGLTAYGPDATYPAPITLTATFAGPGGSPARTGMVQFFDGQNSVGTATISGNTATLVVSGILPGIHSFTASYAGDLNYVDSQSDAAVWQVYIGSTTMGVLRINGEALPEVTIGDAINFSITLNSRVPPPDGVVRILDSTNVELGRATVSNGVASGSLAIHAAGNYTLHAVYDGTSNFAAAVSAPVVLPVDKARSAVDLEPAVNGQFVVTVGSVGDGANLVSPSGSVSIFDGATFITSVTLRPGGFTSFTFSSINSGSHVFRAVYAGDGNFLPGSGTLGYTFPVPRTPMDDLVLTVSVTNPNPGVAVTYTATLNDASQQGTITFLENNTTWAVVPVVNGRASFTKSDFVSGPHAIYAQFSRTENADPLYTSFRVNMTVSQRYVIDLLGLYTLQTNHIVGGNSDVYRDFKAQVDLANTYLQNSQLPVEFRIVGVAAEKYSESGSLDTDLNRLTKPNDGYMDDVAALRNMYGADAVILLDSTSSATEAGVAWEFPTSAKNRDLQAFAVIDQTDPRGGAVLAHEMGHILGAMHAVGDPGSAAAAANSHGYRFIGTDGVQYHDVMAYDPGTLIPYYSNPYITYAGVPIGNVATANAAGTILLNAPTVAAYRTSKPVAYIDTLTTGRVTGWAFDPRLLGKSITLRIDIDGVTRATTDANLERPDLANLMPDTRRGFVWNLPTLSTGVHSLAIYTTDMTTGKVVLLATRTVTVATPLFDENYYLAMNPDVAQAVYSGAIASGWQHYLAYGQYENRAASPYFNQAYYLAHNPDVAAAVAKRQIKSAFQHFLTYGQREGRSASAYFDEAYYLSQNPDIAAAVRAGVIASGLEHYLAYGQFEGRNPIA